jgi:hypothetical protein
MTIIAIPRATRITAITAFIQGTMREKVVFAIGASGLFK